VGRATLTCATDWSGKKRPGCKKSTNTDENPKRDVPHAGIIADIHEWICGDKELSTAPKQNEDAVAPSLEKALSIDGLPTFIYSTTTEDDLIHALLKVSKIASTWEWRFNVNNEPRLKEFDIVKSVPVCPIFLNSAELSMCKGSNISGIFPRRTCWIANSMKPRQERLFVTSGKLT
jgi:hypothetical protein